MINVPEQHLLPLISPPEGTVIPPHARGLVFSFFAGSGFLDLGFEHEGFIPVLVNEYHPPFLRAYQHARAKLGLPAPAYGYLAGSIETLADRKGRAWLRDRVAQARASGLPIGFIGGPPCPDFSMAGKHRGKDGEHGRLTQAYVNLITAQKPDFFVFENVKGLVLAHREHLDEIQGQLKSVGYVLAARLANALEYGVPQDRGRFIMVGIHKGFLQRTGRQLPSSFYFGEGFFTAELKHDLARLLKLPWPLQEAFKEGSERPCPTGLPVELTVQHWFERNRVDDHPNAGQQFKPKAGLARMQMVPEGDASKKSYKRLHRWRFSPTAAYGNNEVHLHPSLPRRLSGAEVLAVQSMPHDFELPQDMTLSDLFKTAGNGVPYLMARGIAQSLERFLVESSPAPQREAVDVPARREAAPPPARRGTKIRLKSRRSAVTL